MGEELIFLNRNVDQYSAAGIVPPLFFMTIIDHRRRHESLAQGV